MKKITAIFYTFQEFETLLRRYCFVNNEDIEVEIVDTFFGRINYYPDDSEELHMSDYEALPVLSKIVGIKLANTHVSHDGIWLESEEMLPPKPRSRKTK